MNICGDCKRFMGCSWEREFKPVEGWTARSIKISVMDSYGPREYESYEIIDCPLFVPPNERYKKPKSFRSEKAKAPISRNRKAVKGVCVETGETRVWESVSSVAKDGFSQTKVSDCINGRIKTHKGWRFWSVRASTVEKENSKDAKGESQ